MNDFDLNKIKKSISSYQIKTTSSEILNAYNVRNKEEKKPFLVFFNLKKILIPTISLVTCGLILAIIIPITMKDNDETQIEYVQANSKQNQAAFSVYSGMSIISKFDSNISKLSRIMYQKNRYENEPSVSFKEVVDVFDPCVSVIESLFNNSINIQSEVFEGTFIGKYDTYPYSLTVYDYTLYTNIIFSENDGLDSETVYKGEIYVDEKTSYLVELEIEQDFEDNPFYKFDDDHHGPNDDQHDDRPNDRPGSNHTDLEIEMTIHYDSSSYLEIEQEIEGDKRTYSYSLYENNILEYEENITFDNRRMKNDSCFVEIINDDKVYEFDNIHPIKNGLECEYRKDRKHENLRFKLNYEGEKRIYISSNNEKITKL